MLGEQDRDEAPVSSQESEQDDGLGFKVFDKRFWADDTAATEGTPSRAEVPSYVSQLQQQVEEKDKKLREYISAYKQEVVENLEQTKKRLERDAEQRIKTLRGELITPVLELMETLERSLQSAEAGADAASLLEGLKMLHRLMSQKLTDMGTERIPTVGEVFDPQLHDAVSVVGVEDPDQNNRITVEISPGFLCDGRVVRPAKVQVGKAQ